MHKLLFIFGNIHKIIEHLQQNGLLLNSESQKWIRITTNLGKVHPTNQMYKNKPKSRKSFTKPTPPDVKYDRDIKL